MRWLRRHPEIDVVIMTHEVSKGLAGAGGDDRPRKISASSRPQVLPAQRAPRDRDQGHAGEADRRSSSAWRGRSVAAAGPAGPQCSSPRRVALAVADPRRRRRGPALAALPGRGHERPDVLAGVCYPALGGVLVDRDAGTSRLSRLRGDRPTEVIEPLERHAPAVAQVHDRMGAWHPEHVAGSADLEVRDLRPAEGRDAADERTRPTSSAEGRGRGCRSRRPCRRRSCSCRRRDSRGRPASPADRG